MADEGTSAADAPAETEDVENNPGAVDEAADEAEAEAADEAEAESPVFGNLAVLPPLQQPGKANGRGDAIALPSLRLEEPVASIRSALTEIVGYAHLTNYRLVLETKSGSDATADDKELPSTTSAASPYTGRSAVVDVPAALKSLESDFFDKIISGEAQKSLVLDEYGDLTPYAQDIKDDSGIRIVLERYDGASISVHLARLRQLLEGNAPHLTELVPNNTNESKPESDDDEEDEKQQAGSPSSDSPTSQANPQSESEASAADSKKEEADQKLAKEQMEAEIKKLQKQLPKSKDGSAPFLDCSNLRDFIYLACGEDRSVYHGKKNGESNGHASGTPNGGGRSKKNKKKSKSASADSEANGKEETVEGSIREVMPKLNKLEEATRIGCTVKYSGFHPPPSFRRLMGDLAYVEVVVPGEDRTIHVTATVTGFYINRSTTDGRNIKFNPSPAETPCFSHELLDCLCQYSTTFNQLWTDALAASKERSALMDTINRDGPFASLFRVACRGDFDGYTSPSAASTTEGIDGLLSSPTWIVPLPKAESEADTDKSRAVSHKYNVARTNDEIQYTFGVDIRGGSTRDWNEELQSAREMPIDNIPGRMERARVMHKVLSDFGEASLIGVKAIFDGQIMAMNPNEPTRSQVYLHNNIFFSRAVDAGIETFKIAKGDRAARKSASRDISCLGSLHRMERTGLFTLATVLIDYLGTRFVCQSILPGILNGDSSHTLLYGTVDAGAKLTWDEEIHEQMKKAFGKGLFIAERSLPRDPLTPEFITQVQTLRSMSPLIEAAARASEMKLPDNPEDLTPTIKSCAPVEAKGIRGSDKRNYILDMTRVTPRDPNWVPKDIGGTGFFEELKSKSSKAKSNVPETLEDDEWTLAVLRSELTSNYTQLCMSKYLREKKEKGIEEKKAKEVESQNDGEAGNEKIEEKNEAIAEKEKETNGADIQKTEDEDLSKDKEAKDENGEKTVDENPSKDKETSDDVGSKVLSKDDLAKLESLRFNVNVFLPNVRSLEGLDDSAHEQMLKDEQFVRDAGLFLVNTVLPRITRDIRESPTSIIPQDGKKLTEFVHNHGVNCRYFGRLAELARIEEEKDTKADEDLKAKRMATLRRRTMPRCWLEMLECEMVARAAKHVLDDYLTENGGSAAFSPSQTVASFLSALVSESEETAAQTEARLSKAGPNEPDEEFFESLTIFGTGGGGDAVPPPIRGRAEIWEDIEKEVARRFRYDLTFYNNGGKNSGRALYLPLLRRICQRTGVRLAAKPYELGSKCLCSGGDTSDGRLTASYPISPLDIVDIVPLMKHAAAHNEGFVTCNIEPTIGLPPLHVSLVDARNRLEAAHFQHRMKNLHQALDLAQEACNMYQRVTDSPTHPGVVQGLELMANILMDAGEIELAVSNATKALGLTVQIGGFDTPDAISSHILLFQMLLNGSRVTEAVKHVKAALYLLEISAGPRHPELSSLYYKLGTIYHSAARLSQARQLYDESLSRQTCDRILEAAITNSSAAVLFSLKKYREAVNRERDALAKFSRMLGPDNQMTQASQESLLKYTKEAVSQSNQDVDDEKQLAEAVAAQLMAEEIEAEEEAEARKQKKKNNKKKPGKK